MLLRLGFRHSRGPLTETGSETLPEPAGEDACATAEVPGTSGAEVGIRMFRGARLCRRPAAARMKTPTGVRTARKAVSPLRSATAVHDALKVDRRSWTALAVRRREEDGSTELAEVIAPHLADSPTFNHAPALPVQHYAP